MQVETPGVIVLFLFFLASFGFVFAIAKRSAVPAYVMILLGSLFLASGLIFHDPASQWYVPNDGALYWGWAIGLLEGDKDVSQLNVWPGKGVWPAIVSLLIYVGGPNIYFPLIFNVFVLLLVVLVSLRAASLLENGSPKWGTPALIVSWLPFWFFGPSLLREAIFWLGVSLGTLALVYVGRGESLKGSLVMLPAVLFLLAIRPDAGLIITYAFFAGGMTFFIVFSGAKGTVPKVVVSGLALALGAFFPFALDVVRPGVSDDPSVIGRVAVYGAASQATGFRSQSQGVGGYEPAFWEASFCLGDIYVAVACNGVVNLPYAMLGPFPWELSLDAVTFFIASSTLHFLILIALTASLLARRKNHRALVACAFGVAAVIMLFFSSSLTNYGTLVRFRVAAELVLLPFSISALHKFGGDKVTREHPDKG